MIRKLKITILSVLIFLSLLVTVTALFIGLTPLKIVQLEGISMTGINREHWFHLAWVSEDLSLKRSDVVIFDPLKTVSLEKLSNYKAVDPLKKETFTKRILAFEGETVEIKNKKLFINNQWVENDFSINGFAGEDMEKIKIPKDHYFVAGDYRLNSLDSRVLGPISKSSIIGEVILYDHPIIKSISDLIAVIIKLIDLN